MGEMNSIKMGPILVLVAATFVFCDATVGTNRKIHQDFTWKYNGEVNIGKLFKDFSR